MFILQSILWKSVISEQILLQHIDDRTRRTTGEMMVRFKVRLEGMQRETFFFNFHLHAMGKKLQVILNRPETVAANVADFAETFLLSNDMSLGLSNFLATCLLSDRGCRFFLLDDAHFTWESAEADIKELDKSHIASEARP